MLKELLHAAACVVCASEALADNFAIDVKFSKAGVSYDQFRGDRDQCLGVASKMHFSDHARAIPSSTPGYTYPTYRLNVFYDCMVSRGYQPDNYGWRAARFRRVSLDDYALVKL